MTADLRDRRRSQTAATVGAPRVFVRSLRWYRTTIRAAYSHVVGTKNLEVDAMITNRPGLLLLTLVTTCLVAGSLLAGPTATLTGRVTDPSGGVIAGVKVEATNVETNVVFTGQTNAEGLYNIPNLPPGTYRVIVQKFAFRTVVKPGVELHV